MARPTIEQLRSIGELTSQFRWDMKFIKLPADLEAYKDDSLNFRCETSGIPKMSGSSVDVQIRGIKIKSPGIYTFDNTIQLAFVETIDNTVSEFIKTWRDLLYEGQTEGTPTTGIRAPKADLEATLQLVRLDSEDNGIWQYTLTGCFLEDYDPGSLDSSTADPMKPSITLSYDYFTDGPL